MKPLLSFLWLCLVAVPLGAAETRPNIVWIVGEDMGPELGCYGDPQALTPNMDRLAREGARYTHCFTHAPVCAPSRSGLITGQYPTTIGTHHMRSKLLSPPDTFTAQLRRAGYHVSWPGKTDFNFNVPADAFDSTADWRKSGKLPKEPFFAYINFTESHESSIRMQEKFEKVTAGLTAAERHDPAKMDVPPYHPDAPEVRRDLANYYDLVTAVDHLVGEALAVIEKQGLASNTIVILTGDHGRGISRSKRWVYASGTHVPLIVRWPGHIPAGTVRDELVSFIDFAPTMLSLAQVPPTGNGKTNPPIQGIKKSTPAPYAPMQGTVFLGPKAQKRDYVFSARDRMDETDDRIRSVRNARYQYIRNFEPQLPYAQRVAYGEEMPTMQVWREWNAAKKLNGPQSLFFAPTKPKEELYDVDKDPHEIHNLAESPEHQAILKELRAVLDQWVEKTGDLGAVPEKELVRRGLVEDVNARYEDRKK